MRLRLLISVGIVASLIVAARADYFPTSQAPTYASSAAGTMYASTCAVTVASQTPTSTFCPVATDPNSVARRTYPAGALTIGKAFRLEGGGIYTVPTANTLSADIKIFVGSAQVMGITTPAAPVGTNQGVQFVALCTVQTSTTINCAGTFRFAVAGTGLSAEAPFNQTNTFTPSAANLIDVTGDWNGTVTTHATTVTEAVLMALN